MIEEEDKTVYRVVINDEEQYSMWPEHLDVPLGWREVGKRGSKEECMQFVDDVWLDMRPLSLRREIEADPNEQ